jgi:hypothetical protein
MQQNHLDLECYWKKNLGIEWEGRGGSNKQGRKGGNPWFVSIWNLDYSFIRCPNLYLTTSYNIC